MKQGVKAAVTVLLLSLPFCTHADTEDELAAIRQQIEALKEQYESRLKELEARLERAEAQVRESRSEMAEAKSAPSAAAPVSAPATPAAANAFNPALSVVLQGSVNSYSEDPDDYAIPGFQLGLH